MSFARAVSMALVGVEGHLVEVEAHLARGLPGLVITGLPDPSVAEARDRVRAAVLNSDEVWPARRITVGLGPAWLPKHGSGFDLAVAAAILTAAGAAPPAGLAGVALIGELGLDGRVRPVRGVLPAVLAALREGVVRVVVPAENAAEARLVPGVQVYGVASLQALLAFIRGTPLPAEVPQVRSVPPPPAVPQLDLADVVGQELGRTAVELAAAGGHHLALFGPPGAGKTMLAERLPGLLPPLEIDAALEVTAIHSVAGVLPAGSPLVQRAPYQAPHHTASVAALVGGGSGLAKPGAISLANRGVLFLDEAPEFPARVLDALRQPLERGEVVIARSGGVARYPARVQLVLAANPCPCASAAGDAACTCSSTTRRRYLGRLSGPLLDRIDIQLDLLPVTASALLKEGNDMEETTVVARRVVAAREAAIARWRSDGWRTNSEVPGADLRGRWRLPKRVTETADRKMDRGDLSARGYDRLLRIAWTVADLRGHTIPTAGRRERGHVSPHPGCGVSGDEPARLARVALGRLVEPGHRELGVLVRALGPAEALERIRGGAVSDGLRTAARSRLADGDPLERAAEDLERCERLGGRLVTPEDDEWPAALDQLTEISTSDEPNVYPPLCLWVRGSHRLSTVCERAVAIVGARAATPYGAHVAGELGYGLGDRDWTVISGGAYGIDGAAHRGALTADGVTIGVLACGVDTAYPVGHAKLFERIGEVGLLISEWPPGATPQRHRFLVRNRVIAALGSGTVVVEAASRSGARMTARRSHELGRVVMAVPGPITSAMSVGPHELVRDFGARLVISSAQVIEECGVMGEALESEDGSGVQVQAGRVGAPHRSDSRRGAAAQGGAGGPDRCRRRTFGTRCAPDLADPRADGIGGGGAERLSGDGLRPSRAGDQGNRADSRAAVTIAEGQAQASARRRPAVRSPRRASAGGPGPPRARAGHLAASPGRSRSDRQPRPAQSPAQAPLGALLWSRDPCR